MKRKRVVQAVASSSNYKVERSIAELRREMRELKASIIYNNKISNEMYERREAIMNGSASLLTKEPEQAYEMCFGVKVYI